MNGYNKGVATPKDRALTIRFAAAEYDAMTALAEARDVSLGDVVRRALREYVEAHADEVAPKKKQRSA